MVDPAPLDIGDQRRGPGPVDRLVQAALRGLPAVVVPMCLATSLRSTREGISDPDTFWHLRAGAELLADGQFVRDTGSHFTQGTWTLHEWAPEVVLALG